MVKRSNKSNGHRRACPAHPRGRQSGGGADGLTVRSAANEPLTQQLNERERNKAVEGCGRGAQEGQDRHLAAKRNRDGPGPTKASSTKKPKASTWGGGRRQELTSHWDITTVPQLSDVDTPNKVKEDYTPHPALELARLRKAKKLRKLLVQLCRGKRIDVPLLCFERWLCRCKLHEQKQRTTALDTQEMDPLLPSTGWIDSGLIRDLTRAKMPEQDAREAARTLTEASCAAAKLLQNLCADLGSGSQKATDDVNVTMLGQISKVQLGDNKPYMTINNHHLEKLRTLFKRHSQGEGNGQSDSFSKHLWCMLVRYESLSGHGYQAALSEHAFCTLRDSLGVQFECFASPLNCYFGRFCSAFPDSDGVFGSIGSFFDFHPSGGSYEANPPFVPELMSAMVRHMEVLLHKSSDALSFTIVIPAWKKVVAWQQLERSPFQQATWIVQAQSHVFCDGAQHQRAHRYRPSSYNTAIIFLQNPAGRAMWPPSMAVQERLLKAMGEGIGSAAMSISEYEERHSKRGKELS